MNSFNTDTTQHPGAPSQASAGKPLVIPVLAEQAQVQVWADTDGRRVNTTQVVSTGDSCGSRRTTVLDVGERTFVGHPPAAVLGQVEGPRFDRDVALPGDARDTGYRREGRALWLTADAAYVVDGDRTERWPSLPGGLGCVS